MGSLCGWIGTTLDRQAPSAQIARMIGALTPSGAPFLTASVPGASIAVLTRPSAGSVFQGNGLLVAVDGLPIWRDATLASVAREAGTAATVANTYERYGEGIFEYLGGTFAIIIFDRNVDRLFMATDRLGVRPLAYAVIEGCILFASTLDGILAHGAVGPRLNPQAIFDYLYFHMVPSPETIYQGIAKLEPGHVAVFSAGRVTTRSYWNPPFEDDSGKDIASLAIELRATLRDAVLRNHANCETTGVFLSGGLDSSTVCGLYAGTCDGPVHSYSIGFDAPGYDEMEYARIAARHFDTNPHEYYVTPTDVAQAIPVIAQAYDEPFGNSSALPVFCCARLASQQGMRVMLAGDGGDELFAGNSRYVKQKVFELYGLVPGKFRQLLEAALLSGSFGDQFAPIRKVRSYIKQARIPLPDRLETYNQLHRIALDEIFEPEFLASVDTNRPLAALRETYARARTRSSLNRMMYLDWKFTLADNDLRKVNQMCAIWDVDVRYPMLDDDVVAFSMKVNPEIKAKGLHLRHFYKKAMRGFLPDATIAKKKHGFGLPFGTWLRESPELQDIARHSVERIRNRGIVRPAYVNQLLSAHSSEHAAFYGEGLWILLMLDQWLVTHSL